MFKKRSKIICLLLALFCLAGTLFSCKTKPDDGQPQSTETTGASIILTGDPNFEFVYACVCATSAKVSRVCANDAMFPLTS